LVEPWNCLLSAWRIAVSRNCVGGVVETWAG